ncbi:hypothetical protein XA68_16237 [Ophiocordyceps unilateralis]|uniref:Protein arginine methyltransferase NDUFAF7 n=1 Tax=Ophiocordyceps unilateralis TaxID=268505 RepID=A0A2A9PKC0_OPHUN|nr:hypothetical protein XA68_16237 [Ophiocordyceps unilateralis]
MRTKLFASALRGLTSPRCPSSRPTSILQSFSSSSSSSSSSLSSSSSFSSSPSSSDAARSESSSSSSSSSARQWSTPLAKQLFQAISTTGPVPLASYMRMCLTGDVGGYYTGTVTARDPFGAAGDFVTSPEVSQVFGELIGLWFVAEWISQARPSRGVQLIEVGPGRGTLMDDMLRTIARFPEMAAAVDSVYMVEASRGLREAQKSQLCGPGSPSAESKVGYHSTGKHLGKPIVWTETIKSLPIEPDTMPLIVAHEFFDALPIHVFQSAPASTSHSTRQVGPPVMEWREMMLVLSSTPTRHSRLLPDSSSRYRKLKQTPGSVVEICPDASLYVADFATRIGGSPKHPKARPAGAALIVDYGASDTIPVNSLRGIRNHCLVSPFSSPGFVDLSADVDFTALAEGATLASDGVEVHGPVPQADFLEVMGICERTKALAQSADPQTAQTVDKACRRLVDRGPNGMGRLYKALAILPENSGRRRPVGFGGDVTL